MTKPIVGGRPLKFETPQDLIDAINKYFESTPREEWTVTGLCLAIGTSKGVFNEYQEREGYKEIVAEAKLMVENSYEISLRKNGRSGDIFALKNFGWKDKQEVDHTSNGKDVGVTLFVPRLDETVETASETTESSS